MQAYVKNGNSTLGRFAAMAKHNQVRKFTLKRKVNDMDDFTEIQWPDVTFDMQTFTNKSNSKARAV